MRELFNEQKKRAVLLRASGFEQRLENLKLLKRVLLRYEDELCQALFADFGKNPTETQITEIYPTVKEINEAIRSVRGWMRPRYVGSPLMMGWGTSWIQYQPKGVSLIVSPWNYPIFLSVAPIVAALAAGCTVILKPSEFVSQTSQVLYKMFSENFSQDLVAVVLGGPQEASELLTLPFDHIFFTGSTEIGKIYMQAAARHLSSLTLELGGKSPTVVDESADLKLSAQKIVWGKFINAGQTCIAPDYLLVNKEIWPAFKKELLQAVQSLYPEGLRSTDLAQIVNEKHHSRLVQLLQDAIDNEAEVLTGGGFEAVGRKIAPTCVLLKNDNPKIMQEEIFGPILPILLYQTTDEALQMIEKRGKPLALYLFSRKNSVISHFLNLTSSGGVCLNEVLLHIGNHELPFGGLQQSGLGSYHGEFGFRAFSHERAIYRQSFLGKILSLIYPPYSQATKKLIRKMIDWNL